MRQGKPKEIVFKWSRTIFKGEVWEQEKHERFGLRTEIRTTEPFPQHFVIYGKCQVGQCGQFNVQSITY